MKRLALLAGFPLMLAASVAFAEGINLSWDDCGGGGSGSSSKTFACNIDIGVNVLVVSFDPPAGVNQLEGVDAQVDLMVGTKLPDWWKHGGSFCRGTDQITASADFTVGFTACTDFFAGRASGGINYTVGAGGNPARARIIAQFGLAPADRGPVTAGTEYYAFRILISRAKTTGAGACAGCLDPGCIVLNSLDLLEPSVPNIEKLIDQQDQNWVTWQASSVPECPKNTPTRSATWGRVKSLYR